MTDPPTHSDDATPEKPPETEASSIEGTLRGIVTDIGFYNEAGERVSTPEQEAALVEQINSTPAPMDLREQQSAPTYTGSVWEVVVIREGMSLNGRFYPREALEASLPLWENADVCAYGFNPDKLDHIPTAVEEGMPEGTYSNRAGFLRNVRGAVNESGRYEVIAEFAVTHPTVRSEMLETHNLGGRLPGFSIHAYGDAMPGIREGRKCSVITAITGVRELTIVSKPAAGGRALRLVAAESTPSTEENQMNLQKLRAYVCGRQPKAMSGIINAMEVAPLLESAAELLAESDDRMVKFAISLLKAGKVDEAAEALEMLIDAPAAEEPAPAEEMPPMMASATTESKEAKDLREAREEFRIDKCERILEKRLAESALPEVAVTQIRDEFAGKVFEAAALDKSIAAKRALLAVNAGGRAVVESAPKVHRAEVLLESSDKVQMGFNLMMGVDPTKIEGITESELQAYRDLQKHPRVIRPRALYQAATGDYDMQLNARSLREAATTSTYSNALGTSINLMLAQHQKSRPVQGWQNIIREVDSDNLKQQDRIILGGFSTLPDVAEGANYTDLGNPKEFAVNYTIGKKGGYYQVTEEAVINDSLGIFEKLRDSVRDAGFQTLDRFAWNMVVGNAAGGGINTDNSYDGVDIYHASHFNTATTALGYAGLVAAHNQLANAWKMSVVTALDDATDVNTSDTTFVVDSTQGFQAGQYFRIDSEICRVTTVDSATQLTVVRAQEGTTAAAHLDNAVIVGFGGKLELEQSTSNGWGPQFFVIVPTDLRGTLMETLQSGYVSGAANFSANYMQDLYKNGEIKPIVVPSSYLGGDKTNWYTAVPWQLNPTMEISYFNGQRAPQVQDETPLSGDHFLADKMKFRIKFRFGGLNLAHEGRTGNIVAN